jgi:hypothetical protein
MLFSDDMIRFVRIVHVRFLDETIFATAACPFPHLAAQSLRYGRGHGLMKPVAAAGDVPPA